MIMTVKQLRRLKELTVAQIAAALGISRVTYAKLENNPGKFTIDQAVEFCRIVGVPFDQVFFVQNDNI